MAETDYVVPGITIEKKGVFDLSEIYSVMKDIFSEKGYAIIEKVHKDEATEEGKNLTIKWIADKDVDDYTKFMMEISIKGKVEKSNSKKDKVKGVISITFESYMERDPDNKWEESPSSKFMRALYDKYALKKKFSNYSKDLKDETYEIYYQMKSYLGLVKIDKE